MLTSKNLRVFSLGSGMRPTDLPTVSAIPNSVLELLAGAGWQGKTQIGKQEVKLCLLTGMILCPKHHKDPVRKTHRPNNHFQQIIQDMASQHTEVRHTYNRNWTEVPQQVYSYKLLNFQQTVKTYIGGKCQPLTNGAGTYMHKNN